jgi:hypothetical protein
MNKAREQALKLALHSTVGRDNLKQAVKKELKLRDEGKYGIMNNISNAELNCLAFKLGIQPKG